MFRSPARAAAAAIVAAAALLAAGSPALATGTPPPAPAHHGMQTVMPVNAAGDPLPTHTGLQRVARAAAPATVTPATGITPPPGDQLSLNWAGYVDTATAGKSIRFVTSDFKVPAINCQLSHIGTSGFGISDDWVGLGGVQSGGTDGLAQDGIESWCSSSGPGAAGTSAAWYFICCKAGLPLNIPAGFPLAPNDELTFSTF